MKITDAMWRGRAQRLAAEKRLQEKEAESAEAVGMVRAKTQELGRAADEALALIAEAERTLDGKGGKEEGE